MDEENEDMTRTREVIDRLCREFEGRVSLSRTYRQVPIPLYAETAEALQEFWGRFLAETDMQTPGLESVCGIAYPFGSIASLPRETVYCNCGNRRCILIQIGPMLVSLEDPFDDEDDEESEISGIIIEPVFNVHVTSAPASNSPALPFVVGLLLGYLLRAVRK